MNTKISNRMITLMRRKNIGNCELKLKSHYLGDNFLECWLSFHDQLVHGYAIAVRILSPISVIMDAIRDNFESDHRLEDDNLIEILYHREDTDKMKDTCG